MTLRPPEPGGTGLLAELATAEGAEALLTAMAGGLFPTGFDGLERLTWREPRGPTQGSSESSPEERLLAAEARFRTLVEQIPAVTFMAVLGEGMNEVYVSPHIEAMLGFSQAEWLENPFLWYYQLHPDDRKLWNEEFTRGCQTGGPFRAECRFLSRSGQIVWVHGEARLVKDEHGRPQFLQGVAFDITENKRAQEVLLTEAVRTAKVQEEHAIARRVQTSILPRTFDVGGLELAAAMWPAEDVGGDYYDVFRALNGAWLTMGDVSGHGLNAGLIMLMVQSAVASITTTRPDATPAELIAILNEILFDAISSRLESNAYVTLVLVRYWTDGRVTFAGAHEHILLCRRETGRVERIETPGPWLGINRYVRDSVVDSTVYLGDGDLLVLFTDGIIEAMNGHGEQFDMERLCEIVEEHHCESPEAIQTRIIAAVQSWMVTQEDDLSVLVARYRAGAT
ncbi:MAG TPA: SpoIIE family protein phosphatase [Polyangiaceae bacterium]|nr:SpoIIE family protein phosphatase [Polyangiaceae bacterium]